MYKNCISKNNGKSYEITVTVFPKEQRNIRNKHWSRSTLRKRTGEQVPPSGYNTYLEVGFLFQKNNTCMYLSCSRKTEDLKTTIHNPTLPPEGCRRVK